MAAPPTQLTFLERVLKSRLLTDAQVNELFPEASDRQDQQAAADKLVKAGLLTRYQAQMIQAGKHRGFFLGPYKILRPLGQGGMGTVFLAEHTSLSRKVAVKVLPPDKAKDKLTLERFNREARAAAALDHPNIVRLHDISQGNGVHFLVMEYVEGTDLQSLMGQTGPLHYAQAAQYVAQAAAGLQHAHEKGFIHRDIKPANLMLTKVGGGIKILDMGLARSFTDSKDALTANLAEGDIAGTVDYLSPEQAMNQPLDERSDIYSLGATFYSLVAGHPPFKGTTAQKLMQHQLKEPPSVSLKLSGRVPQALSDVISKMMSKRPSERFQTAADVIDALGPWLPVPTTGSIITDPSVATPIPSARSSGRTQPIRKSSRMHVRGGEAAVTPLWKRPAVLAGAGIGLLMLVGGIIAAVALSGGKPADPTNPVVVHPPPSAPNPTPPTTPNRPSPNPPKPAASTPNVLYRLDASALKPFRRKVDNAESYGGPNIRKEVPGWHYEVYDKDSTGEVLVEADGDRVVLGIGSRSGKNASQFVFQPGKLPSLDLVADHEYEVRVEYKTEGGVAGGSNVQTIGDWKMLGNARLQPTATWKTHAVRFTRPEGKEVQITFGASEVGGGFIKIRSVEIVDPSAPAAGKPLYALDLSQQKAFRDRGRTDPNAHGSGKWGWKSAEKKGDGSLPAGWTAFPWRLEDEAEYLAEQVDGQMALGFSTTQGTGSAMLFLPQLDHPSGQARLAIEYRSPAGVNLFAKFQQTKPHNERAWDIKTLPGTDGKWRTETLDVDLKGATGGFFELHNNHGDGQTIHLRSLTISDPTAVAAAPPDPGPASPKSNVPVLPVKADLTAFKDGFYPLATATAPIAPGQTNVDVPGWWANQYGAGDTGELTVATEDGAKVLTLANKTGGGSAQLFQTSPGPPLASGGAYLLKLEYRAADGTSGRLEVREKDVANWKDCPYSFKLESTGGKWERRTFEMEAARDYPTVFVVQNQSAADGNSLSVRSLEVVPVGGAEKTASQVRAAYRLEFSGVTAEQIPLRGKVTTPLAHKPFAGADWHADCWAEGAAGELAFVDDGGVVARLSCLSGTPSAQLFCFTPAATLTADREYTFAVTYKTTSLTAVLDVRTTGDQKDRVLAISLPQSDPWKTVTKTFRPKKDTPLCLFFQNSSPDSSVTVRSLVITESGK